MELKITRQRNEANEISIDMDMMINGQRYHLTGYINFEEYNMEVEIARLSTGRVVDKYKDLYDFCEEVGHNYGEIKDYIMNHTDHKITN